MRFKFLEMALVYREKLNIFIIMLSLFILYI
jgi:hypothetical protein